MDDSVKLNQMPALMNRPQDIFGNPIEIGPWYWAKSRTGKIVGTGKFSFVIGSEECTWFINGTGYSPENFTFVRVVDAPEEYFARKHDWCADFACRICGARRSAERYSGY